METTTCDICGDAYEVAERHVVRIPRPSDPSSMCGILWLCPGCGPDMGAKTEAEWEAYIESPEAAAAGHFWLE